MLGDTQSLFSTRGHIDVTSSKSKSKVGVYCHSARKRITINEPVRRDGVRERDRERERVRERE